MVDEAGQRPDDFHIRVSAQESHLPLELLRQKDVVGVKTGNPFAARFLKAAVPCRSHAEVFLRQDSDAPVPAAQIGG